MLVVVPVFAVAAADDGANGAAAAAAATAVDAVVVVEEPWVATGTGFGADDGLEGEEAVVVVLAEAASPARGCLGVDFEGPSCLGIVSNGPTTTTGTGLGFLGEAPCRVVWPAEAAGWLISCSIGAGPGLVVLLLP